MNWEVIDTKASKLTMEKKDFFIQSWVDVEKISIIRLVQQNSGSQLIAGTYHSLEMSLMTYNGT